MFAGLEYLSDDEEVNRAWENIKNYIKISAKKSKSARIEAT